MKKMTQTRMVTATHPVNLNAELNKELRSMYKDFNDRDFQVLDIKLSDYYEEANDVDMMVAMIIYEIDPTLSDLDVNK